MGRQRDAAIAARKSKRARPSLAAPFGASVSEWSEERRSAAKLSTARHEGERDGTVAEAGAAGALADAAFGGDVGQGVGAAEAGFFDEIGHGGGSRGCGIVVVLRINSLPVANICPRKCRKHDRIAPLSRRRRAIFLTPSAPDKRSLPQSGIVTVQELVNGQKSHHLG